MRLPVAMGEGMQPPGASEGGAGTDTDRIVAGIPSSQQAFLQQRRQRLAASVNSLCSDMPDGIALQKV